MNKNKIQAFFKTPLKAPLSVPFMLSFGDGVEEWGDVGTRLRQLSPAP